MRSLEEIFFSISLVFLSELLIQLHEDYLDITLQNLQLLEVHP